MPIVIDAGRMVLHYRFVEKLGEGAMGLVWKAIDTTLDREVAIKVLRIAVSHDPDRLARFEREARLLARVTHPGIARVYSLHHVDDLSLLAMELVAGEDLSTRLARHDVSQEESLDFAAQIIARVKFHRTLAICVLGGWIGMDGKNVKRLWIGQQIR